MCIEKRVKNPVNIHNKNTYNNHNNNMLSVFNHCLTINNKMKKLKSAVIPGETSTHLIGRSDENWIGFGPDRGSFRGGMGLAPDRRL